MARRSLFTNLTFHALWERVAGDVSPVLGPAPAPATPPTSGGRATPGAADSMDQPSADASSDAAHRFSASSLVYIRHPRARRYVLRVRLDGTVRVTMPRRGSQREARAFAESQRAWIERQLVRAARDRAMRVATPPVPESERKRLMARARVELPARLLELAAVHGLTVQRVSIRNQKWRWGSCSPSGRISLNWRLITMPDAVRDYVLIHELMHLRRMDHSPAFWRHVAEACPDYQACRAWLRQSSVASAQSPVPVDSPSL